MIDIDDVMPVTYVNSAASLKAFCGRHGGIVCTSANARAVLDWSFARRRRVLFFPDQHLGRNTARTMGMPLEEMPVWDPRAAELGGNAAGGDPPQPRDPVEGPLQRPPDVPAAARRPVPRQVSGHQDPGPSRVYDGGGRTGRRGRFDRADHPRRRGGPAGDAWAIGTELHLVNRLKQEHPEQQIHFLSPVVCMCATMYRIDLPHLCWALENLAAGTPVNVIRVDDETARWALEALERMLEVK